MINVRDLIHERQSGFFDPSNRSRALTAMKLMAENNTGAPSLVMTGEQVLGIVSERDRVRKVDILGKVGEGHSRQRDHDQQSAVCGCQPVAGETYGGHDRKNIRHLPVYENGKLAGLISVSRNVLKEVVDYQKFMISQLEHYISNSREAVLR